MRISDIDLQCEDIMWFAILPEEIQKILSDHVYEGDVVSEISIKVRHAY
ncbi:MAG: hypothetical protein HUJ76_07805 [Parasporobacterium sp.]|nr:hypothetical protein [Parasporobacterium sp.]